MVESIWTVIMLEYNLCKAKDFILTSFCLHFEYSMESTAINVPDAASKLFDSEIIAKKGKKKHLQTLKAIHSHIIIL